MCVQVLDLDRIQKMNTHNINYIWNQGEGHDLMGGTGSAFYNKLHIVQRSV